MKIIYLLLALFIGLGAGDYAARSSLSFSTELSSVDGTDPLMGVEDRVTTAATRAFMRRSVTPLLAIRKEVAAVEGAEIARLRAYWLAHIDFQTAVFFHVAKESDSCEGAVRQGIKLLEEIKDKNSEEYALLAYLQGFSIQFAKGLGAAKISKTASRNAQLAVKLDAKNLRGYYVLGSLNFYTPKAYGGGKKVEEYMTKAISLPANPLNNPYLPSWGRAEAYELLVRQYVKEGRQDDARRLLREGLDQYPDNYLLNNLVARGK